VNEDHVVYLMWSKGADVPVQERHFMRVDQYCYVGRALRDASKTAVIDLHLAQSWNCALVQRMV
jgi:hypothetical protein